MTVEAPILAIIGPTASGKSSLAIAVARQARAEILSVDSMQVYQAMDIGTAKPSLAERFEIPHHLIDWVRPDEMFSVARFVELADEVIAGAAAREERVIAVGGTPLYFKALFEGLFEGPAADETLRDELRQLSDEELHEKLEAVDKPAATRIHGADRRRMIRAIEVQKLTGEPISRLQTQWQGSGPARHPVVWVGLKWDKEAMNRRINARVMDMLEAGWLEEVAALLAKYPRLSKTAGEATGYKQLIEVVRGRMKLADAVEEIKIATRQLARRQMKWLRRFAGVRWLPGDRLIEENVAETLEVWKSAAPRPR